MHLVLFSIDRLIDFRGIKESDDDVKLAEQIVLKIQSLANNPVLSCFLDEESQFHIVSLLYSVEQHRKTKTMAILFLHFEILRK